MSRFNADITYVKGTENCMVDSFSRYYKDGGGDNIPPKQVKLTAGLIYKEMTCLKTDGRNCAWQ